MVPSRTQHRRVDAKLQAVAQIVTDVLQTANLWQESHVSLLTSDVKLQDSEFALPGVSLALIRHFLTRTLISPLLK